MLTRYHLASDFDQTGARCCANGQTRSGLLLFGGRTPGRLQRTSYYEDSQPLVFTLCRAESAYSSRSKSLTI